MNALRGETAIELHENKTSSLATHGVYTASPPLLFLLLLLLLLLLLFVVAFAADSDSRGRTVPVSSGDPRAAV